VLSCESNDSEENVLGLKGDIRRLQIDLRERQQQITSMEREIKDMDKDINHLTSEKSKAQARSRSLENELRITKAQVDELVSTNLDNENVIRMKDSQIALLQESVQQRAADETAVNSKDYQTIVDSNNFLQQQLDELQLSSTQANESRVKAEQAKKNALDQLHMLRQEAEIQREDLRSAELETKKAWKIVGEANAKSSQQAKELKEAQEVKIDITSKLSTLQRKLDEMAASTKIGGVEKSRLETEVSTLSRRLKMEQELTRRAETDLANKNKELGVAKRQDIELMQSKITSMSDQKDKMEITLKEWQARHADIASRLDASETQKSRAILEIEDLVTDLGLLLI
jgi:chromosome segregation ATPase